MGNPFRPVSGRKDIFISASLTPFQTKLITLHSEGQPTAQIVRLLDASPYDIEVANSEIVDIYNTRNMAAAVNQAIRIGQLAVEHKPAPKMVKRLSAIQKEALGFIAAGFSNKEIASQYGRHTDTFQSNILRPIFSKVRANGRTHSVRRAYELGIFEI